MAGLWEGRTRELAAPLVPHSNHHLLMAHRGREGGVGGQSAVGVGVDEALRAVGAVRAVGAEGVWAHIEKPLNTSKRLENPDPNQGRPSEDNGRGAVGAVREGGDDVEWVESAEGGGGGEDLGQ